MTAPTSSVDASAGTVAAIYVATEAAAPMHALIRAVAVADGGLEGDRYLARTGHWSRFGRVCQVTLMAAEDLEAIRSEAGVRIDEGQHRRNVVLRNVDFGRLRGRRFRIGEAEFEHVGPRSVCRYIERITQPGMTEALRGRGGACVRVVRGGAFSVGDAVTLVDGEGPRRPRPPSPDAGRRG